MSGMHIQTTVWRGGKKRAALTPRVIDLHPCAEPGRCLEGCFGHGPPICPQVWWCFAHRPADFYDRGGADVIRSRADLMLELKSGETVAMLETWAIVSTGEAVHGVALRAAIKRDELRVLQRDICGEPMQYGARTAP